jgi:hypothetical protein
MLLLLHPSQPVVQGRLHQLLLLFVCCLCQAAATVLHASVSLLLLHLQGLPAAAAPAALHLLPLLLLVQFDHLLHCCLAAVAVVAVLPLQEQTAVGLPLPLEAAHSAAVQTVADLLLLCLGRGALQRQCMEAPGLAA